jgi:cephalosporin hydroxylase
MKITIDTDAGTITAGDLEETSLYSKAAFEMLSDLWVKVGWTQRYSYTFTWLGRPVIQLPEDMLRIQEVIYRLQPDVIVEAGVAHGGSLIFYASLFEAMGMAKGKGRVVGVDIDIRAHNRTAIEDHRLAPRITLIESSSSDVAAFEQVSRCIEPGDTVLVILDSNHSRDHVLAECWLYAPLVSVGSYIVAADGIMRDLTDVPGGDVSWATDNPFEAARAFAAERDDFVIETPGFAFNESDLERHITYWPGAYLRRVS